MEDDDHRQFKEANAAVTRAVAAFVSEIEFDAGEMGKRRPRLHHREHAVGTVHRIVRSGPRYQDRRRTGNAKAARRAGRVPGLGVRGRLIYSIRHSRLNSSATRWAGILNLSTERASSENLKTDESLHLAIDGLDSGPEPRIEITSSAPRRSTPVPPRSCTEPVSQNVRPAERLHLHRRLPHQGDYVRGLLPSTSERRYRATAAMILPSSASLFTTTLTRGSCFQAKLLI